MEFHRLWGFAEEAKQLVPTLRSPFPEINKIRPFGQEGTLMSAKQLTKAQRAEALKYARSRRSYDAEDLVQEAEIALWTSTKNLIPLAFVLQHIKYATKTRKRDRVYEEFDVERHDTPIDPVEVDGVLSLPRLAKTEDEQLVLQAYLDGHRYPQDIASATGLAVKRINIVQQNFRNRTKKHFEKAGL